MIMDTDFAEAQNKAFNDASKAAWKRVREVEAAFFSMTHDEREAAINSLTPYYSLQLENRIFFLRVAHRALYKHRAGV
jgi:hypothetical protein